MHQREISVVRFAMFVLFSAIMVVYLLLYQIKGDDIIEQLNASDTKNGLTNTASNTIDENQPFDESTLLQGSGNQNRITKSEHMFEYTGSMTGNIESGENTTKITILSGTSLWYGRVEAAEKLGISYQYALKDQNDIYYVFIDPSKKEKIEEIVKALGGTTHTIATEKEIMENKLFGDQVMFVNLPEYKGQKVVMVVTYKKQLRLIQVDYTMYHKSKGYMKQLFIK